MINNSHVDINMWVIFYRAWFLRIASVRELLYVCLCVCLCVCVFVCVCVCPPPRLSITSGVMWCDIDPIRLVE